MSCGLVDENEEGLESLVDENEEGLESLDENEEGLESPAEEEDEQLESGRRTAVGDMERLSRQRCYVH